MKNLNVIVYSKVSNDRVFAQKGKRTRNYFYLQYHPVKIFLLCLLVFRPCHPPKLGQKNSTLLTFDLKFKLSWRVNVKSTFRRFKQFKQE